jgi:hypothetical protein
MKKIRTRNTPNAKRKKVRKKNKRRNILKRESKKTN